MNRAEMKVVRFEEQDVIATSSFHVTGLFNGTAGDAKITSGTLSYSNAGVIYNNLASTMSDSLNLPIAVNTYWVSGKDKMTTGALFQRSDAKATYGDNQTNDNELANKWNGIYVFDGTRFVKQ